jgi:hypothetical protein
MSCSKKQDLGRFGGFSTATASASKKSIRADEQDRLTSLRRGRHGLTIEPSSTLSAWSSLTKPAPAPTWRGSRSDRSRRRTVALPAALFAGLQSDRAPLREAQSKLRKAAERSVDGVWNRIAGPLEEFSSNECANYFRHAAYASC